MTPYREIVFAALILFAPHISLSLAIWIVCGLIVGALIMSDAVANAVRRIRKSMSHYE